MTVKEFDRLKKRDFENGAVRDEIRQELKRVETLATEIDRLNALLSEAGDRLLTAQLKEVKLTIEIGRLEQLLNPKPEEENDA